MQGGGGWNGWMDGSWILVLVDGEAGGRRMQLA